MEQMRTFRKQLTDTVSLVKQSGMTIDNLKAHIGTHMILMLVILMLADPPIEKGDVITRKLPMGNVERFTVTDPVFHKAGTRPAHYQIKFGRS